MRALAEALGAQPTDVILLSEPPISFHRCLVQATGGITTALLLSHALRITQALPTEEQGWFVVSRRQWSEATALSQWEQETARRALCRDGFLQHRISGRPLRVEYRVECERLLGALRGSALRRVH